MNVQKNSLKVLTLKNLLNLVHKRQDKIKTVRIDRYKKKGKANKKYEWMLLMEEVNKSLFGLTTISYPLRCDW